MHATYSPEDDKIRLYFDLAPALVAAGALTLTGGALPHLSPASPLWTALALLTLAAGLAGLYLCADRAMED